MFSLSGTEVCQNIFSGFKLNQKKGKDRKTTLHWIKWKADLSVTHMCLNLYNCMVGHKLKMVLLVKTMHFHPDNGDIVI